MLWPNNPSPKPANHISPRIPVLDFKEIPESKIFPNAAFGYWKVVVERPLRLRSQLSHPLIDPLRFASGDEEIRAALHEEFGGNLFVSFKSIAAQLEARIESWGEDEDGEDGEDEEGVTKTPRP